MTIELSLVLGGAVDARTIGDGIVGDVEVAHIRSTSGSGLHYVKFNLGLPRNFYHPSLEIGTKVEVFRGDHKMGSAVISEVNRRTWDIVADGLFKRAEKYYVPSEPNTATALDAANTNGLGWAGVADLDLYAGDVVANLFADQGNNSIASALTTYCSANSRRWGIDNEDRLYIDTDPYYYDPLVSPQWAITPGVPLMPVSEEVFATVVRMLFQGGTGTRGLTQTYTSVDSQLRGDTQLPGGYEFTMFAEPAWGTSSVKAQWQADEMFNRLALRFAFTEGLNIWPGELTTPGGVPIENWAAYQLLGTMGNHQGAINQRNWSAVGETVQWVAGSTVYRPAEDTLKFGSVDLMPRNLPAVFDRLIRSQRFSDPIATMRRS